MGPSPRGRREQDMTERAEHAHMPHLRTATRSADSLLASPGPCLPWTKISCPAPSQKISSAFLTPRPQLPAAHLCKEVF